MKRTLAVVLLLLISVTVNAQGDDYQLGSISPSHWGIWVPRSFDRDFRETGIYSTSLAMNKQNGKAHDILIVEQGKIWSDSGFHDGYAIKKTEFSQFTLAGSETEPVLIDNRGNNYIFIGAGNRQNYTEVFSTYILSIVQEKLEKISKTIPMKISGSTVIFAPSSYNLGPNELLLDLFMFARTGFDAREYSIFLFNRESGNTYGLKLGDQSVVVDLFAMNISMEGVYTKKTGIGKTQVFELFGR